MPPKKRASNNLTCLKKRVKSSIARGTLSLSPSRLSPRRALSQLRKSRPKDAIVAPTKGSERVTVALFAVALDNKNLQEALDASLIDDFKGIN
ncbi:hypothetical protein BU23DRAFT_585671 [Bimuria novae-zelandiae CBS 107.79]|uniref:Uncharacterized protein n=1 Tax=Bimuria novae-zelandiae CBS 107.79 TaxID=1447943 RepID=A0A6A5USZ1_9PLEO|nr:hypothetical protein BU23DRAFT_585671 [Bimuria novae-zelandiae CBS 107.79]